MTLALSRLPAAAALALLLAARSAAAPAAPTSTTYRTDRVALDRLRVLMDRALAANRRELRGRTGRVQGFAAGTLYPQIWLRDSATLLPLARWSHPRPRLASWIEEHLAHQKEDGSLYDWIAAGEVQRFAADAPRTVEVHRAGGFAMSADRNSSESDQEPSAVQAAARVFAATGDLAWLRRAVGGRPLLDRLRRALEFTQGRRDRRTGLVVAALTADWGDVTPVYGDQRAIYLDDETPRVGSLYATVQYAQAAADLGRLLQAAGDVASAARWHAEAESAGRVVNARLWDEHRGFYRMHVMLKQPPSFRPLDSSDLFAMGGNALAALAGVAPDARAARIFATAEERRRRHGLPTIAGVLLPPYPVGFFKHPILRAPWTYQNGGQWDWWGGRLVWAEFERGRAVAARRHLLELAEQAAASDGLFEWRTRTGEGRGSRLYAGSAGALGAAIYEGLFGIDLTHERLDLSVRLGDWSAEVRAVEPATGAWVSFAYTFDRAKGGIRLRYQARARPGRLAVLLPAGATEGVGRLDGRPVLLERWRVGDDAYVGLTTDWREHLLEITPR